MPIDPRRREAIEAAVAAHNAANRQPRLTPNATRLLTEMFAEADVCRRNLDSLVSDGLGRETLLRLLRRLSAAGFLTKTRGVGRSPNTYRLHLPPRVQP
jgi:hypothetical protein